MTALILANGNFLEPTTGEVTSGNLGIVDGLLASADEARQRSGHGEPEVHDLHGAWVMPGLMDAHFHAYGHAIGGLTLEKRILSYVAINATKRLGDALKRGFTTVRDVAGGDIGLQQALDQGIVQGPRYLFSGPALSQTGGHSDQRDPDYDIAFTCGNMGSVVDGVDAMRQAARERLANGAHCIKIMASGGVASPTDPLRTIQYSPEEISAATAEANRRGSYAAAHAYTSEAVIHAVTNGVRSIEHGNLMDDRAIEVMAEHGAYLVPTLIAYDAMNRRAEEIGLPASGQAKNREVLVAGRSAVERAQEAGVRVGFGTDLMSELENEQLQGIALQAQAQSPINLIRSMTTVNAEIFGMPELGTLAPGTPADLLILVADPLADVSVLWDETLPRTVIRAGQIVT